MTNDVNNETDDLTVEQLRTYKGFENISDSEAEDLIRSYDILAEIFYACFQDEIRKNKT